MLMRRRFIRLPSGYAFPSPKQPEQNPARAQQRPGGRLGHRARKNLRVGSGFVGPIADLPPVSGEVMNVYPAVVEASHHVQPHACVGVCVALEVADGANI